MRLGLEALIGSDREEITIMAFTFEIDGCTVTHPAKFSVHAASLDGQREAFWTDNRDEALGRFNSLKAEAGTDFLIAFDYEAGRDLGVVAAVDPDVDYKALSDATIAAAIERMHDA